jgi:hypothetical protein
MPRDCVVHLDAHTHTYTVLAVLGARDGLFGRHATTLSMFPVALLHF